MTTYQTQYTMPRATSNAPQRKPRSYEHITVTPLSGALGARITDVDLSNVENPVFDEIHRAFLDHQVLTFPNQNLTPERQTAFAGRFGELMSYSFAKSLADHPFVTELRSQPDDIYNFGGGWHSDSMNYERPPKITMLYCLVSPAVGGDTSFANLYLAWDSLSEGMQRMLRGMRAMAATTLGYGASTQVSDEDYKRKTSTPTIISPEQESEEFAHPVARQHDETGRLALYVCAAYSARFERMTQTESLPIMRYLWERAIQPEFTCRVGWAPGTLTLWDNRCCMHYAHNDYPGETRVMHRVLVQGARPK